MKKKTLREIMIENDKAMDFYSAMSGKPSPYREAIKESKPRVQRIKSDIPSEHEEQKNFVKWFRMQHSKIRMFAVPNAASRSYELASYLRAEGLSPGCPDLWIPEWKITIEMKRIKGSVTSQDQIEWRDYLLSIGWSAHICNGFDEAKNVIQTYRNENIL